MRLSLVQDIILLQEKMSHYESHALYTTTVFTRKRAWKTEPLHLPGKYVAKTMRLYILRAGFLCIF